MCMSAIETLTLAGLLADPLTRMVMHSDGVSETDHAALWQRLQDRFAPETDEALAAA